MQSANPVCQVRTHKSPEELMALVGKPLSEVDKNFAIRGNFKSLTASEPLPAPQTTQPKFAF